MLCVVGSSFLLPGPETAGTTRLSGCSLVCWWVYLGVVVVEIAGKNKENKIFRIQKPGQAGRPGNAPDSGLY